MDTNHEEALEVIHAWVKSRTELRVEYSSAMRDSFAKFRGRITSLGSNSTVITGDEWTEIAVDLSGASVGNVGTKKKFKLLGLDPDRYAEQLEISLGNMDRLVLATVSGM